MYTHPSPPTERTDLSISITSLSTEVFVFEFGSAVFWGFSRGEEASILKLIRAFVIKGIVEPSEFEECEDDMAFVTSPNVDSISIGNDVITLPGMSLPSTPAPSRSL